MIAWVFHPKAEVTPAVEEKTGAAMLYVVSQIEKKVQAFPVNDNDNRGNAPHRVARARAVEAMSNAGMSHRQIAVELGISRGNVASLAALVKKLNGRG